MGLRIWSYNIREGINSWNKWTVKKQNMAFVINVPNNEKTRGESNWNCTVSEQSCLFCREHLPWSSKCRPRGLFRSESSDKSPLTLGVFLTLSSPVLSFFVVAGRGLPSRSWDLGYCGSNRISRDRGCQPSALHGSIHHAGNGSDALPAGLSWLLWGHPWEQVPPALCKCCCILSWTLVPSKYMSDCVLPGRVTM